MAFPSSMRATLPIINSPAPGTIACLGLGTYLTTHEDAVMYAVKTHGCRVLDTAEYYENEDVVGRVVRESGVKREDFFISTKLWVCDKAERYAKDPSKGIELTKKLFHENLNRLGLAYVDLYYIHSPHCPKERVNIYRALLDLQKEGLIRHVGVSNYGIHHIKEIEDAGLPLPAANQIELHPFKPRDELVAYCREKNILVQAYSPLAKGTRMNDPVLNSIAHKYNKSVAQVMIRWGLQMGFSQIPKSDNPKRIDENFNVFDFDLNEEDMKNIRELAAQDYNCTWDPTVAP